MYYVRMTLTMTIVYLALTSNLEPLNILVGALIGVGVTALMGRSAERRIGMGTFPRSIWASIRYVGVLVYDLAASGVQIARLVLSPSLPVQTAIIDIPSRCQSELGAALSAHAITVTPGELVVEMAPSPRHDMYTHVLEADKAQTYVHDAQTMRRGLLDEIFP